MPISRAELPEEFYDITSAHLLAQPEAQHSHARMALAALQIDLMPPGEIGWRGIGGQGADYADASADRLELASSLPSSVFATKVDFKGAPGHTMRFNRPQYTNTTYTEASRQIGTNQTISTTPITAGSEQVTLTIKRYGGPYDSNGGNVAPYALDAFDASMGVHNLAKFVGTHLKRDFHRTIDSFYVTLCDLAPSGNVVYPEGVSADNDMATATGYPLTYEMISRTSRLMDDASLPTLGDGRRLLFVRPAGKKQLKDDSQYARYAEFHKELNPLFPGYMGSLPEFHIFCSSTLTTSTNASSVTVNRAQAIAPGALLIGLGRPPSVRSASDDNYGETAKVIWLADLANGVADQRFLYNVRHAST